MTSPVAGILCRISYLSAVSTVRGLSRKGKAPRIPTCHPHVQTWISIYAPAHERPSEVLQGICLRYMHVYGTFLPHQPHGAAVREMRVCVYSGSASYVSHPSLLQRTPHNRLPGDVLSRAQILQVKAKHSRIILSAHSVVCAPRISCCVQQRRGGGGMAARRGYLVASLIAMTNPPLAYDSALRRDRCGGSILGKCPCVDALHVEVLPS